MGISSKKTKTTATNTGTTSMATTPTNPEWVTNGVQSLSGKVNNFFQNLDPYSLIAGPDPLQTRAAQGASELSNSSAYQQALDMLKGIGTGPNTYNPTYGTAATGTAKTYDTAQLGDAKTYSAAQLGPAGTYSAAQLGPAGTYTAAQLGKAGQAEGATIDPTQNVQSASLLDGLGNYMSPYTKDVVDASLADFDYGAGKTRAQQALDLAGSPFAGSRAGVAQSLTEGELARGRGSLSAGLRDQAFNTGANLSNLDAGRRQDASTTNASMFNNRAIQQAGLTQGNNQFNTGESNKFGLQQGLLDQQALSENTAAGNNFKLKQGDLDQQALSENTAAGNSFRLKQGEFDQQTGSENTRAINDRTRDQGLLEQQTRSENTGAENQFGLSNLKAANDFGLANMGAANDAGRYNATAADTAASRGIDIANGMSGIASAQGANSRANLSTQMDIGSILQQLSQAKAGSPLAALAAQVGLNGQIPFDLFKGSNSTGTTSGTSTGTSKESGASMGDWLQYFAANAKAAASGGGGG